MNILDIKRRIIFISAAVKYIKIIATKNDIVLEEDLEILTDRILDKILIDENITLEEKSKMKILTSQLIKVKDLTETSNEIKITIRNPNTITINSLEELSNKNLIKQAQSKLLTSLKNKETVSSSLEVLTHILREFEIVEEINLLDSSRIKNATSVLMEHFSEIYLIDKIIAKTVSSLLFEIKEDLLICDKAELIQAVSELLNINEKVLTQDSTKLEILSGLEFEIKDLTETSGKLEFVGVQNIDLGIDSEINLSDQLEILNNLNAIRLEISEALNIESYLEMSFKVLIPVKFSIKSEIILNEILNISNKISNQFIINNDIIISNISILSLCESLYGNIDNILEVNNDFIMAMYRRAIIDDYDDKTIGSFKNETIFHFLYVLK